MLRAGQRASEHQSMTPNLCCWCGKIDLFGIDSLVNMLAAAGLKVRMRVAKAA